MNLAKKVNLVIDQGSTFTRVVAVQNADGSARDLTGYTARMVIARSYAEPTPVVSLTPSINTAQGMITISMTDEQTDALTIRSGVYDLKIESGAGVEERILQGGVVISPQVTS